MRRFFIHTRDINGEDIRITGSDVHHIKDVLRLGPGAKVVCIDESAAEHEVNLTEVAEDTVTGRIIKTTRPERPIVEVALFQGLPKGRKFDFVVEKATELGAVRLTPVVFGRSATQPSAHALERLGAICIAAAKQCGANFLPEVGRPVELGDFLAANRAGLRLLGSVEAKTSLPSALTGYKRGEGVAVLIGPEGGLTEAETTAAVDAGFVPVRLGDLTLRVETAAAAMLAAVTAFLTD